MCQFKLQEALVPFVRALEAAESKGTYHDNAPIFLQDFDYCTRYLGRNNEEIVVNDYVRLGDLRHLLQIIFKGDAK